MMRSKNSLTDIPEQPTDRSKEPVFCEVPYISDVSILHSAGRSPVLSRLGFEEAVGLSPLPINGIQR